MTVMLLILGFAAHAHAVDTSVEAEGVSNLSREDAIRQAQRLAVGQAVGVFVQSETEIENFRLKKNRVFSRTEGYITKFDVIEERKVRGIYKVKINAVVSLDKIKDDLMAMKILLESLERPKIMILLREDYRGMDNLSMDIARTELSSLLGAKGFDLVDSAQLNDANNREQVRQALAGDKAAARSLGLTLNAQYVILGKAVAQDVGEAYAGTGLKSIQASLELRILQTQTALVLGSVGKTAVTAHISPLTGATTALKKCAQKAVDEYLVATITNSFQDFLNNGLPIKLHITNVKTFREYKRIVSSVQTSDRVVSSKNEGWNKAGGILVLGLRFKGTSEELAELLDGKKLGEKTLEVEDFGPEKVECRATSVSSYTEKGDKKKN